MYELKKNNQELEKFKFVLDYKIKELKKQIEPRENQISGMNSEIAVRWNAELLILPLRFKRSWMALYKKALPKKEPWRVRLNR